MILIDISQLMIANVTQSIRTANDLDEDLIRHMILNSIRKIKVKFGNDYGEVVICCDSRKFWRKEKFQYYKSSRKKARDESFLDWKKIFSILDIIKSELHEIFPYRVVEVEGAEADDIIAVLASKDSLEYINNNNKILIVSGDKDFIQLQRFANVEQYDPINKRMIVHNDPKRYLVEHIVRGDSGDGVPNVLSADNSFVMGIRQKPVTAKVMQRFLSVEDPITACLNKDERDNFIRNMTMIDMLMIPEDLSSKILLEFDKQAGKKKDKMVGYFMQKKLAGLFPHINEF